MSEQFRKLLEQFYIKVNNSPFLDVYKKILIDQFDQVEEQPIHVISTAEQPSLKNNIKNVKPVKRQQRRQQYLYKSSDFASVFLFALMLDLLKRKKQQYLNIIRQQVNSNLEIFYGNKQNQDATRYRFIFKGFFDFCRFVFSKKYHNQQIQKLMKAFYLNTLQRRGLKKTQRQKYSTQSQIILSFILGHNNQFPSKKQLCEPTSDTYEYNNLQFCINIQNLDEKQEEWTIGEGENHINVAKQKLQYFVYQEVIQKSQSSEADLDQTWTDILMQSQEIKKQQSGKTRQLFDNLNIDECKSPTKSSRPPKSVYFRQGAPKAKLGNFF